MDCNNMEWNKDEARRAKAMAEMRIECNDFPGARTFALRAQTLDPELGGISQMLSMLDVHLSAERRVGGEVDWYGVLGVDPSVGEETIESQYNNLARALHPDQNSLQGANSALKLVSKAKCLLLDRARRATYDRIAGYQPIEQEVLTEAGASSARADGSWSTCQNRAIEVPRPVHRSQQPSQRALLQSRFPRCPRMCRQPSSVPDCFEVGNSSRAPCQMPNVFYRDPFLDFPKFPSRQPQGPSDDFEAGNPSEVAAKEDDDLEAAEFLVDMVDDWTVGDSLFHVRRRDEDEDDGGGRGGVLRNNNPSVAEANEKVESVYACW